MKILLVITHGNMGGATNVVYELAHSLREKGVEVSVGFGEGDYLEEKLRAAGIPRHRFSHLGRSHNPIASLLFLWEIGSLVRQEKFDAIQCNSSNTLPGCLGAKIANKNVKTIFTIHGLSILDANYRAFFLLKWGYRFFFKFFLLFIDSPVFVSRNDLAEAKQANLVKEGFVIYNGLDAAALSFMPRNESRSLIEKKLSRSMADAFIIGSIGRLSYQKNYEFFISTFAKILKRHPRAVGVIIGDGPHRTACQNLIAKLGLENAFFLLSEMRDAPRYLKAFDLFVLTSRYEGLPVTLVECLFARVPVIASDVGGNREIIEPASRYASNDEHAYLAAIDAAFEKPDQFVPQEEKKSLFASDAMAEQYLALTKNR